MENEEDVVSSARERLLKEGFPEISSYTSEYIKTVFSVENRTFEQGIAKFINCITWRRNFGVDGLTPSNFQHQLACQSVYWYGFDKFGIPILWVRPTLKNSKTVDVRKELEMHVHMMEDGIKHMPEGCTTFTFIADVNNLGVGDFDLGLMKGLIEVMVQCFPDRLEALFVGPTNFAVRLLYKFATAIMPTRLTKKVHLMEYPEKELLDRIKESDLPVFFGGSAKHPSFIHPKSQISQQNNNNNNNNSISLTKSDETNNKILNNNGQAEPKIKKNKNKKTKEGSSSSSVDLTKTANDNSLDVKPKKHTKAISSGNVTDSVGELEFDWNEMMQTFDKFATKK